MLSNEKRFSILRISHLAGLAADDVEAADAGDGESLVLGFPVGDMCERIEDIPRGFLFDPCAEGEFADESGLIVVDFFHGGLFQKELYIPMQVMCQKDSFRAMFLGIETAFKLPHGCDVSQNRRL